MGRLPTSERSRPISLGAEAVRFCAPDCARQRCASEIFSGGRGRRHAGTHPRISPSIALDTCDGERR